MIKQTICFTNPAYLSLKNGQMVIDTLSDKGIVTRPIEDIGIIVLENRQITITSALLSTLSDNNTAVMVCDSRHLPTALLLPLAGNTLFSERTKAQINSSLPLRKQLWQQTVASKIANQAAVLKKHCSNETGCMDIWAKSVRSGDPDNLEATAAIFYWKNLFTAPPNKSYFQRHEEDNPINALLNYGYAIIRGIIARALVGAGLMPQIGIFHSNKYNAYCLADDIMEPYRPYVDHMVKEMTKTSKSNELHLTPNVKRAFLSLPIRDVRLNGLTRPLLIAAEMTATSLAKCYNGESRKILYPSFHA